MAYLDALVPAVVDQADLLERLRLRRLTDAGATVDPGPLDEATLNLLRRVLRNSDSDLVLALPQGRHDVAVALGLLLQLNRLGARMRGRLDGEGFDGPLVVVGLNVNLTERLRQLKIGAENLSDALRAQRVRADGTVISLRGTISSARAWRDGLLYLNTSLGWPRLDQVRPGLVIIDRTSFRNAETLDSALAWAETHQARRVIVLGIVGDPCPPSLQDKGRWLRWGWTPGLRRDVYRELGNRRDCGPLSTNALLTAPRRPVVLAEYQAPELTRLRRRCLRGIAAARRTNKPFPPKLADAVQLVNLVAGTWGKLSTADLCAAQEPRGLSTTTLRRYLRERRDNDLPADWAEFRETHWGDLRRDVLGFAELLNEYNPRFEVLRGVLEWAATHRPDIPVVVRTHSRSAARALLEDLLAADPVMAASVHHTAGPARLAVVSYGERLPWACRMTVAIYLGVPPPWRRACLMSGEATEHVLVVDPDEKQWAARVLHGLDTEWQSALDQVADDLGFDRPPGPHMPPARTIYGPVNVDDRGDAEDNVTALPALDLERVFAAVDLAVGNVDRGDDPGVDARTPASGRSVLARPITFEPGDHEYWLPSDATAEVLVGSRYSSVPVSALTTGMSLLIPRGETREELYGRLLQAAHRDADVAAVNLVLQRFRKATWDLYRQYGTWEDVLRALRSRGAAIQTAQTCRNWAEGRVIAPEDVADIQRVAWLTGHHDLTIDRTWERIGAIAAELRRLHRELGRVLSGAIAEAATGQSGENLRKLTDLCGGMDPSEVLEEFELRQIRSVGGPASVPASQLRKVLSSLCRTA